MATPEIRPETMALLNIMAGSAPRPSHVGAQSVDLGWIDPLALGDLSTAAHKTEVRSGSTLLRTPAAEAARAVLEAGKKMEPAFRWPIHIATEARGGRVSRPPRKPLCK